jgi:hypothetical protein
MNNLAIAHRENGRLEDAVLLQEKTLQIRRKCLSQKDPLIGDDH